MPREEDECPLCSAPASVSYSAEACRTLCSNCGRFTLGHAIDEDKLPYAEKAVVSGYVRRCDERPAVKIPDHAEWDRIVAVSPSTAIEKASRFLSWLSEKQPGEFVRLDYVKDRAAAYAYDRDELIWLARYLELSGLIESGQATNSALKVRATVEGHAHVAEGKTTQPLSIFISSTCYDLIDVRPILAEALESVGHIVLMSDDPQRFNVDLQTDSITNCLANLEQADLMIGLIDRRYGGVLPDHDISATHLEFNKAAELDKPRSFFIRDRADLDFDTLRGDIDAKVLWVQESKREKRELWVQMVKEAKSLKAEKPNWFTRFKDVMDLRKLVLKAVADHQNRSR